MQTGLRPADLLAEREYRVTARMAHRLHLLQNLPAALPHDQLVKAKLELRALKLLDFQRRLRADIVATETSREAGLAPPLRRNAFRKRKKQVPGVWSGGGRCRGCRGHGRAGG